MPVLSIKTPSPLAPVVRMAALKRGIEADTIEVDGNVTYIDLIGARDKINGAAAESPFVTVLDRTDSIPHGESVFTLVGRIGFDE